MSGRSKYLLLLLWLAIGQPASREKCKLLLEFEIPLRGAEIRFLRQRHWQLFLYLARSDVLL